MRHVTLTIAIAAFIATGLMSCGQTGDKKTESSEKLSVPGAVKESKHFTVLVPEGWQFSGFDDGTVQVYNTSGSYMLQAKRAGMNMNEKDLEMSISGIITQYKGTPVEKVEMLGLTFLKSTYDASGSHQTLYAALKNGEKISIQLMGPQHETDKTIQAVLQSLQLK